jgi:hypothetical protein
MLSYWFIIVMTQFFALAVGVSGRCSFLSCPRRGDFDARDLDARDRMLAAVGGSISTTMSKVYDQILQPDVIVDSTIRYGCRPASGRAERGLVAATALRQRA